MEHLWNAFGRCLSVCTQIIMYFMFVDPPSPQIAKPTVWASPPNPCASSDKALLPPVFWGKSYEGFFDVFVMPMPMPMPNPRGPVPARCSCTVRTSVRPAASEDLGGASAVALTRRSLQQSLLQLSASSDKVRGQSFPRTSISSNKLPIMALAAEYVKHILGDVVLPR